MMCFSTHFVWVTRWITLTVLTGCLSSSRDVHVERKSPTRIQVLLSPYDVEPAKFTVPEGTANATWIFQAFSQRGSCSHRQVEVHLQHGSLPPFVFSNETYPDRFFLNRTGRTTLRFPADNSSHTYTLLLPRPGNYYTLTFVTETEEDNRLMPGGLNLHCTFRSWMALLTHPGSYTEILANQEVRLNLTPGGAIYWFAVPESTLSYQLALKACEGSCDLLVFGPIVHSHPNTTQFRNCSTGHLENCSSTVEFPDVEVRQYFSLKSVGGSSNVTVEVTFVECQETWANDSYEGNTTRATCLVTELLDRWQGPDVFHAHFLLLPSLGSLPDNISLTLLPEILTSVRFLVDDSKDTGATLSIALNAWQPDVTKESQQIKVCGSLLKGKVTRDSQTFCGSASHLMMANSSSPLSSLSHEDAMGKLHVPYPEAGLWFLTLKLFCYHLEDNGTERVEPCSKSWYNMSARIEVNQCLEGFCSGKGKCVKLVSSTDLLFYSICDCTARWKGYACSDGDEALSDKEQLEDVLLLTLSNLVFMPVIVVAMRRGFYTEAGIYSFNMFFSMFYHACDTNGRTAKYTLCIGDYNLLQFGDFLASTSSVWFTFMAASRISVSARSFFQVMGVLCFSLFNSVDRFNFWINLGPGLLGSFILISSWPQELPLGANLALGMTLYGCALIHLQAFTCHQRHGCYPSKKRYLFLFLPGVVFGATGICVYMFAETKQNYKFTHSFWHVTMCLSVLFLLPRRPLTGQGAFPVKAACLAVRRRCCQRKSSISLVSTDLALSTLTDVRNHTDSTTSDISSELLRQNRPQYPCGRGSL